MSDPREELPPLPEPPTDYATDPKGVRDWARNYARLAMAPLQERIRELEYDNKLLKEIYSAGNRAIARAEKAEAELAALRAQEPVAVSCLDSEGWYEIRRINNTKIPVGTKLYAAPVADGKAQEPQAVPAGTFDPTHQPPYYRSDAGPTGKYAVDKTRADEAVDLAERLMDRVISTGSAYLKVILIDPDAPSADTRAKALEEADKRDAERYRWLRSQVDESDDAYYEFPMLDRWQYRPGPQPNERFPSIDAAIDAAITGTTP